MKVISIINLKGGVAKTTTAVSMAELLAEGDKRRKRPGSRVLLFDNDKQGNASRLFEVYRREEEAEACRIIKTGRIVGNIRDTREKNLDIIPCNYFMELAELEIKAEKNRAQHDRYKHALEEVAGQYDYCIIDNTKDWTYDQRSGRTSVITGLNGYSVYNKKNYQLTHLLEKGHQLRRGGRTYGNVKAFEHIAPVNETLGDLAVSKITQKVRG